MMLIIREFGRSSIGAKSEFALAIVNGGLVSDWRDFNFFGWICMVCFG